MIASIASLDISEEIVELIPPPRGDQKKPLKALIFDSYFDDYRGVVLYVRVFEGEIKKNAEILMMAAETKGIFIFWRDVS